MNLAEEERTIVLYESPNRLKKLLSEINIFGPDRLIALALELRRTFEEVLGGSSLKRFKYG